MTKCKDFGMYLETVGFGVSAHKFREKIGEEATKSLHSVWSGQIVVGQTTPDSILALLGHPNYYTEKTISYLLGQRTDYCYTFTFDSMCQVLVEHGYQRIKKLVQPAEKDTKWQAYLNYLTTEGATTHEVMKWLGEPLDRYGWWPIEIWEYTNQRQIHFLHGIVTD